MIFRDRIKELRRVPASMLLPNPKNWRRHPLHQRQALRGLLAEIGFADALLARETPQGLMLLDGHLRAEITPGTEIPVLIVDLTDEEADKLLATLDPLAAMAEKDQAKLNALLKDVASENDAVSNLLASLAATEPPKVAVPSEFAAYDEHLNTDHKCPQCGFEWSGKAKQGS